MSTQEVSEYTGRDFLDPRGQYLHRAGILRHRRSVFIQGWYSSSEEVSGYTGLVLLDPRGQWVHRADILIPKRSVGTQIWYS